jgi:hypothetical protein
MQLELSEEQIDGHDEAERRFRNFAKATKDTKTHQFG